MLNHTVGLLLQPHQQWQKVSDLPSAALNRLWLYPVLLALLPTIAWYYGTTQVGWEVGKGGIIKLTVDSAQPIFVLFYLTMVSSVIAIGFFIHWMADTYGAESSLSKGVAIASLSATPLFLIGSVGFYPIFWIDLTVGMVAVSWAVYLMYLGIPAVMRISTERGFLFSSAVLAVCLVILMTIMGGSVILWDMGAAPTFTD